jgi:hypothetical protein
VRGLPLLALQGKNWDSAGNSHLMDESTGGIVIPPVFTSSWKRSPPEEWLFCRELLAQGQGIHWRNVIPPEITSL